LSLGKSAGKNTSGSNRFFKQPEKPLRDLELDMIIAGHAPRLRSGVGRLRRNRVIVVVSDILTADHDRITSRGVVVRPAEDAGANASFKDNKAPGGVTSSARDGGIEIDGGVSAPAGDAAVVGEVARAPLTLVAKPSVSPEPPPAVLPSPPLTLL
jgi:hypothetical protein